MSKILLFADLHAHEFRPYATVLPNGMNSRLSDAICCIDQIHEYAVNHAVDLVLFGGDMFHIRKNIAVQAFNAVFEAMSQFSLSKIPVFMLHGNHDQADKEGSVHSIHAFRTFLQIADKPGWVQLQGKDKSNDYAVLAIPYTENLEQLRDAVHTAPPDTNQPTILLGHFGVQGARVGADFVYRNPHDACVADLDCDRFGFGFLGHFHEHQRLPGVSNFWYIGAPLQHNWGDSGQRRGFLVLDTENGLGDFVSLDAPRFIECDIEDMADHPACWDDSYVRLLDDRAWSRDEVGDLQRNLNLRSLEVLPRPIKESSERQEPRLAAAVGMPHEELIDAYVRSGLTNTDGLDDDYLISLGHQIMQEATTTED